MMKYITYIFCLAVVASAHGSNAGLDSLSTLLSLTPENNHQKVDLMNQLAWEYHRIDIDQTQMYSQQALDLAAQLNYQAGLGQAMNYLGIAYAQKGKRSKSIELNREALEIARAIGDKDLQSEALNDLGVAYLEIKWYEKALSFLQQSFTLAEEINSQQGICFSLMGIGTLHEELGDVEKAKYYYSMSIEAGKGSADPIILTENYLNLGTVYELQGQMDSARTYYQKTYDFAQTRNDLETMAYSLLYMAYVDLDEENYERSIQHMEEGIELLITLKSKEVLPHFYTNLAHVYESKKEYRKAIKIYDEAYQLCLTDSLTSSLEYIFDGLAECYGKIEDYEKAYVYQRELKIHTDSIFDIDSKVRTSELEALHALKAKDAENKLLRLEQVHNQELLTHRSNMAYAASFILLLVSILAFILFWANRRKKGYNRQLAREVADRTKDLASSNERLLKLNQELERFTYIASHDLKEPLRNICGFSTLLDRDARSSLDEPSQEYLSYIIRNARQMHLLIEDVLEFSKIRRGVRLKKERIDVGNVLAGVQQDLKPFLDENNARIHLANMPVVQGCRYTFDILFKNLIKNGIRYNKNTLPQIYIDCRKKEDHYLFTVRDNGIGIDPRYWDRIFEMFSRLNSRDAYEGSGLGLSICQNLLTRINGRIWVEQSSAAGTTFCFTIPFSKSHLPHPPKVSSTTISEIVS